MDHPIKTGPDGGQKLHTADCIHCHSTPGKQQQGGTDSTKHSTHTVHSPSTHTVHSHRPLSPLSRTKPVSHGPLSPLSRTKPVSHGPLSPLSRTKPVSYGPLSPLSRTKPSWSQSHSTLQKWLLRDSTQKAQCDSTKRCMLQSPVVGHHIDSPTLTTITIATR